MKRIWQIFLSGRTAVPQDPARSGQSENPDQARPLSAEARAELLWQFRNGANPETAPPEAWKDFWHRKLGRPFAEVAQSLFAQGLLVDASPRVKLEATHSLSALKELARQKGLKVSGPKTALAERLIEHADPVLLAELRGTNLWMCSDAAQKIAEEYRQAAQQQVKEARRNSLDLFRRGQLREAAESVRDFEQTRFFPRAMGLDGPGLVVEMAQDLRTVSVAQPEFHRNRIGLVSSEMRERAALSVLWGTEVSDLVPKGGSPAQQFEITLMARMLEFHARFIAKLRQARKLAQDGHEVLCEVSVVEDHRTTCSACLNDTGRICKLGEVLELPHGQCACHDGCRCVLVFRRSDRG